MSKPAIEVKNLSKVYNIGHERKSSAGTVTLRDAITNVIRKPAELVTGHKLKKEKFWALKDINFEINSGDVVGIIGRNGSGKSTLLKVMSRIVEPTHGEIIMRGKTASLLEVGTGFHPELTGRENIYFNGSILGMKKKEIEAKFDEIIAFSEIEKFLDTPVKFYSSGMYVRLAFAVAAHLEPDILIVDEVLAVGDAAFQKKCLGKMQDVAGQGRTVLFVSHNMRAVSELCTKAILLKDGKMSLMGPVTDAIDMYIHNVNNINIKNIKFEGNIGENMQLFSILVNGIKPSDANLKTSSNIAIEISGRYIGNKLPLFSLALFKEDIRIFTIRPKTIDKGDGSKVKMTFNIPPNLLKGGDYTVGFGGETTRGEWFWNPTVAIMKLTDSTTSQDLPGLIYIT